VFGHRFRVEDYCLAVYCEVGYCEGLLRGQGRFHFFYFLGKAKGPGKREGAQIAIHS
jgi:hypothetical protein